MREELFYDLLVFVVAVLMLVAGYLYGRDTCGYESAIPDIRDWLPSWFQVLPRYGPP